MLEWWKDVLLAVANDPYSLLWSFAIMIVVLLTWALEALTLVMKALQWALRKLAVYLKERADRNERAP